MSLEQLTDQLLDAYFDPAAREMQHIGSYELPSADEVEHALEGCRALLFPGYTGHDIVRGTRSDARTSAGIFVTGAKDPQLNQTARLRKIAAKSSRLTAKAAPK